MMIRFLLATGSILLTQLVLIGALGGIGILVRRAFGLRALGIDDCFLSFWSGLAIVTLFLLLWNFLLPVDVAALSLVLTVGVLGLFVSRRELRRLFERDSWRPPLLTWPLLGIVGLWLANLAIGPLEQYDSALYHLQTVRWAESFPAVPGIGNLDGRLALNNSILLFDALLSVGPWEGRSNHIANGLLVLAFLAQSVIAGARLAVGQRDSGRIFEFLPMAVGVIFAVNGHVSSFTTDLGPTLMLLVVAAHLYTACTRVAGTAAEDSYRLFTLGMLLSAAVSFKTNAAPFAATSFALAIFLLARRRKQLRSMFKPLAVAMAGVGIFATAFLARGVVLSGYPLFPSSVAGFPVEWRVPSEHADAEFDYIVHSGRASTQNLPVVAGEEGFFSWFPRWTRHAVANPYEIVVPLCLVTLAALSILVARRGAEQTTSSGRGAGWWLLPPIAVALVAWFSVAPEPRYATPYVWALASLCVSEAFRRREASLGSRDLRAIVLGIMLLGISPAIMDPVFSPEPTLRGEHPIKAILKANLSRPGRDSWFQPTEGKPALTSYRTRSGLLLNTVPALCWDAPLPCTANPAPNLRLRDGASFAGGFVVDGAWEMQNWPMDWQPQFLSAWRKSRSHTQR